MLTSLTQIAACVIGISCANDIFSSRLLIQSSCDWTEEAFWGFAVPPTNVCKCVSERVCVFVCVEREQVCLPSV